MLWVFDLQVVQEYERAVIFRLGRIKGMRAHGPGSYLPRGMQNAVTII